MENNSKVVKLWEQLGQEAEICKFEQMPEVVIRDLPAPQGYRAQLCLKRIPIYHRAFEIKARGWIQNVETKEVQFETGAEWLIEKSAKKRLQDALQRLDELVRYREVMKAKNAPVGHPEPVVEADAVDGPLF